MVVRMQAFTLLCELWMLCLLLLLGRSSPASYTFLTHTWPDQLSAEGTSEAGLWSFLSGRPPLLWYSALRTLVVLALQTFLCFFSSRDQAPPRFLFLRQSKKLRQTGSWDNQRLTTQGDCPALPVGQHLKSIVAYILSRV